MGIWGEIKGRAKNITNPSKWKVDGGDAARAYGAYATFGASELLGKGDDIEKSGQSMWDDLSGKNAEEAAARAKRKQIEEIRKGQEYTQGQVDQGRGYIQSGTKDAAESYRDANKQSSGYLGEGYQNARGDIASAPDRLGDLYSGGLAAGFQTDPGYQFRLQQGLNAIEHSAAARGGRAGGDTLKALQEYGQNFASNEYNNYANRQIGLAGAADQNSLGRAYHLSDLSSDYGKNMATNANLYGQNMGQLYTNQGSQLAGIGMQGAGINAGLTQSAVGVYAPTQQGPSGMQQIAGIGGMALGAYLGGPGGAAVGQQAGSAIGGAVSNHDNQSYYV